MMPQANTVGTTRYVNIGERTSVDALIRTSKSWAQLEAVVRTAKLFGVLT